MPLILVLSSLLLSCAVLLLLLFCFHHRRRRSLDAIPSSLPSSRLRSFRHTLVVESITTSTSASGHHCQPQLITTETINNTLLHPSQYHDPHAACLGCKPWPLFPSSFFTTSFGPAPSPTDLLLLTTLRLQGPVTPKSAISHIHPLRRTLTEGVFGPPWTSPQQTCLTPHHTPGEAAPSRSSKTRMARSSSPQQQQQQLLPLETIRRMPRFASADRPLSSPLAGESPLSITSWRERRLSCSRCVVIAPLSSRRAVLLLTFSAI